MADGVKVRSGLEELREHFDMEKIAGYFLLGKLAEWLEDRFYDEEAEKIRNIDKNAPDFDRQICEILGVDYNADDEMDVAFLERVNEKKAILREKTANETYSDLMSYADSYMDRMVDQYRNYASSGSLRAYFRSIKANLERLCQ